MRELIGAKGDADDGPWDMGAFLPAPPGTLALVDLGTQSPALLTPLIATITILHSDRRIAMTRVGIQNL